MVRGMDENKPRLSPYWDRWNTIQRVVFLVLFFGGMIAVKLLVEAVAKAH